MSFARELPCPGVHGTRCNPSWNLGGNGLCICIALISGLVNVLPSDLMLGRMQQVVTGYLISIGLRLPIASFTAKTRHAFRYRYGPAHGQQIY